MGITSPPAADRHPESALEGSARTLNELTLRLHLAQTDRELLDMLGKGLQNRGLRYALYVRGAATHSFELYDTTFPDFLEVSTTVDAALAREPTRGCGAFDMPVVDISEGAPPIPFRWRRTIADGAWACLPIGRTDEPGGMIALLGWRLLETDLPSLARLAEHLGLVLDQLRGASRLERLANPAAAHRVLYNEAVNWAEQLVALSEGHGERGAFLTLGGLLPYIAEAAVDLLEVDLCTITLAQGDDASLVPVYAWPGRRNLPIHLSAPKRTERRRTRAALRALARDPLAVGARRDDPVETVTSVPIRAANGVIGAIEVTRSTADPLPGDQLALLETFARQAATAFENGRLTQQIADDVQAWEETFDAISDGICVRDQACRMIRANRALARILGASLESLVGARLCDLLPELAATCKICNGVDSLGDGRWEEPGELRIEGPTPTVLSLHDFPARVSDRGIVRWVTVIRDVTMERSMQETLVRSERMRALGEMASGVAHDFNNLLATVLFRAELLISALPGDEKDDEHAQSLRTIRRAALDGVNAVRRIQEYSRVRRDLEMQEVDLNTAVQEAIDLTRHKWRDQPQEAGAPIEVVVNLGSVRPVRGRPSDFREVFTNLIFNAVDAMPHGGIVTIGTVTVGDQAVVSVADTGQGMPEEVRLRIFDPFFTTKGEKGTGLGLSVSAGIIDRSGGEIAVDSAPGHGTTFTIRLPAAALSAVPPPLRETPSSIAPARILVVDDERDVLESLAALLRRDGHQVTACVSPQEAIERFARESFDCVITDLEMPALNGRELARAVRTVRADVPVILMSGRHADLTSEQIEAEGIAVFLAKPCTQEDLRRVLGGLSHRADVPATSLRILVVDDQRDFAEAVAMRLELEGHVATCVFTGGDAVATGVDGQFDLAIVDDHLPDMRGTEVARALRQSVQPPFVAITSGAAISAGDAAFAEVADAVLPKPWRAAELTAVLNRAARRHSHADDAVDGADEPAVMGR
ncbi:MAG: hypothetical protein QOF51_2726 [Chloroflexota bacterium]|jgi:PAS domain S-box-containing protein|nr:hypothetical protein [Chloroflexota bacterium]